MKHPLFLTIALSTATFALFVLLPSAASAHTLAACSQTVMIKTVQNSGFTALTETTSISVDACTLAFLAAGGKADTLTVQTTDGSIPSALLPTLRSTIVNVIAFHVSDLQAKGSACPHGGAGIAFTTSLPSTWLYDPTALPTSLELILGSAIAPNNPIASQLVCA